MHECNAPLFLPLERIRILSANGKALTEAKEKIHTIQKCTTCVR